MKIKKTGLIFTAVLTLSAAAVFTYFATAYPELNSSIKASSGRDAFSFVKSMEGTSIDGRATQANEALVVDAALRRLFEYYLAATGEKPLADIRAEIERELDKTLAPNAARQAKEVLTRFLNYKQELAEVEKNPNVSGNASATIKKRFNNMQQLRLHYFSAQENLAMFGFDDAYDRDALARLEISEDRSLSEAQKKTKISLLDAAMPAALREEKEAPYQVIRLEENTAKMRAQGASDDDVYRMRAASTTPEAAARLAALDREEAEWKNRIAVYQNDRSKLLGNASLPASSQNQIAGLQQLRDQQFTQSEQKRLSAYE